jgi:hypothetical protein
MKFIYKIANVLGLIADGFIMACVIISLLALFTFAIYAAWIGVRNL